MSNLQESIEIISGNLSPAWMPARGENTDKILDKVFGDDKLPKEKVLGETYSIMKQCGDPKLKTHSDLGLVFGYIQSGKTLSFTTLAAMARDNDYQIIIVIAGITTNLLDQSVKRLNDDLDTMSTFSPQWEVMKIQSSNEESDYVRTITNTLNLWKDENSPDKPTLLITVMKQTDNLNMLNSILGNNDIDLNGVPTLVIDDEGDQASLNNEAAGNNKREERNEILKESTIYRNLLSLRDCLPHHTFLQYTATPQANVFIDTDDRMSPNFICLVSPGDKYTGGKEFFKNSPHTIQKIKDIDHAFSEGEIPKSLIEALQQYFIGVSDGLLRGEVKGNPKNRTMMIHPGRERLDHENFKRMTTEITESWIDILKRKDNYDDAKDQLLMQFKKAYDNINDHSPEKLNPFKEIEKRLVYDIASTKIVVMNIDNNDFNIKEMWNRYSQILIGGDKLARGFTVEGLTVTYMPRKLGVGNSDTVQQRARFFGYRKSYLNYCRVWLRKESVNGFERYVESEESWRENFHNYVDKDLNLWKRSLQDIPGLNWTRNAVLRQAIKKIEFGAHWVNSVHINDNNSTENNFKSLEVFLQKYKGSLREDEGDPRRSENVKHHIIKLSLLELYQSLLQHLIINDRDNEFKKVINHLKTRLDADTKQKAIVYLMKKGEPRERSTYDNKKIKFLFQGKNFLDSSEEEIVYPGDINIFDEKCVTLQIHNIITKENNDKHLSFAIRLTPDFALKLVTLEDV